jgi:2-desacetyl-2-hydroxyethyl bacteriochlorophyllide A dehydrogenase
VKAAVVERPRVIVVKDVPKPKLESDYDIIVRVRKASICRHPDYELWQGLRPPAKGGWEPADYPFILGHEFSGEIVEMGSKVKEIYPELKVGDRICEWSWCEGFAEYVRIDTRQIATLAPLPDNVSDEEGAVLELAGGSTICYAWAAVKPLDKVLVLGCGPAGLCIMQHAKNFGAEVVVGTDIYENRLRLARKLGADGAYNASEHDPDELGRLIKREFGAMDVVIDTAGSSKAVFTGTEALKPGGPFYIFAHVSEHVTIPYMRVATKLGHFGHPTNWPDDARVRKLMKLAVKWVSEGKLDVKSMITHRFPLDKIAEALKFNWEKPEECIKVVVDVA